MHALVVDDSKAMRLILRRILTELGFDVAEAANGLEALDRLDEVPADVALVDWNMPEMDGISFVREVRQETAYDDMRIVMVTSESDADRVATALKAGADEYAMKPFDSMVILEKLSILGLVEA